MSLQVIRTVSGARFNGLQAPCRRREVIARLKDGGRQEYRPYNYAQFLFEL
jgi:hypothetical protein